MQASKIKLRLPLIDERELAQWIELGVSEGFSKRVRQPAVVEPEPMDVRRKGKESELRPTSCCDRT